MCSSRISAHGLKISFCVLPISPAESPSDLIKDRIVNMHRHRWFLPVVMVCLTSCTGSTATLPGEIEPRAENVVSGDQRPDILMVVVDDLGWADVGFSGGRSHLTPKIDAFARDAVFFDNAYSDAPNCAPSRCSMITGLATPRHGVLTVGSSRRGKAELRKIEPVPSVRFLSPDVLTLPDRLQDDGYRTVHIGKFHVGPDPLEYGFTDQIAGSGAGHPKSYSSPYRNPSLEDGMDGEYLTDRLADEAVHVIEGEDDRPLFMHLSFYSVHTPIQPRGDLLAESRRRLPEARGIEQRYDAMVSAVDEAFGRVLEVFEARDRPKMVIFTSDHGGYGPLADNGPLRGSKGMLYEGGIRVPLLIRWPGERRAGCVHAPVLLRDLVPTILEASQTSHLEKDFDAVAISSDENDVSGNGRSLHWHFPVYLERDSSVDGPWRTTPVAAVRKGRYKLIEFFEDGRLELYDLLDDPSESRNLAMMFPEVVSALKTEMDVWRRHVGAELPSSFAGSNGGA